MAHIWYKSEGNQFNFFFQLGFEGGTEGDVVSAFGAQNWKPDGQDWGAIGVPENEDLRMPQGGLGPATHDWGLGS